MLIIKELTLDDMPLFWKQHILYLVSDEIVTDKEDIEYFKGTEYRDIIENHMERDIDRHHVVYFVKDEKKVGAAQFCTYKSEDGKCFILDFWVFPEYRGHGMGHICAKLLDL